MIDAGGARLHAARTHLPPVILVMLFVVAALSALLAGYGAAVARRGKTMHMLLYATVTALTVYVILDIEHPRAGVIRMDGADQTLIEARRAMD